MLITITKKNNYLDVVIYIYIYIYLCVAYYVVLSTYFVIFLSLIYV